MSRSYWQKLLKHQSRHVIFFLNFPAMLSQIIDTIMSIPARWSRRSDSLSPEDSLQVKIISRECDPFEIAIPTNDVVANVKMHIIRELVTRKPNLKSNYNFPEEMITSVKLLRIRTREELKDAADIREYMINANEEFLMSFRRSPTPIEPKMDDIAGPSEAEIVARTSHLPSLNSIPIYPINHLLLQDDLRKVFITLAKEAAYILCVSNHSIKILKYYQQKIGNYMRTRENAFKVMYKLGFSPKDVNLALHLTANNYSVALDWLIDNVKNPENTRLSMSPRTSLMVASPASILSPRFIINESSSIQERLSGLLGVVEFYSEMDEPVYDMNLDQMVDMGYDKEEAREALRIVKNNVGAAVDYLKGSNSGSVLELREGLDQSSDIYKLLIQAPACQGILSYTEAFVYFNKILEDHIIEWDPDKNNGKLMRDIITKYYDEKHCLVANQFH